MYITSEEVAWNDTTLSYAGCTDIGRQRQQNEDALLMLREAKLFCIADGVGGHKDGIIASRIAMESIASIIKQKPEIKLNLPKQITNQLKNSPLLIRAVKFANFQIHQMKHKSSMATTIVAMIFSDKYTEICHVGDSRAYLFRNNKLACLTEDHSLVFELYKSGKISSEQLADHPQKSLITKALGANQEVEVSFRKDTPLRGDSYILCSDGLNSHLSDKKIQEVLREEKSPAETVTQLMNAANLAGGKDNTTIVNIKVT